MIMYMCGAGIACIMEYTASHYDALLWLGVVRVCFLWC